ncbi:uridine-cytidine kinase-like 1 isoform X2 [Pectinophora gossypiella]|uniref:uridine-cytidine kinase-like 1 isoform X2 n=1 Tax=Pectinophora gossypiella TaxID=13191 RepID=UPI00214F2B46|nr:uridine-cytidine kinase-like 1 isoform X2 [Pectinophora gossypiella]
MAGKLNKFETPSSASSDSDTELALELSEQVFLDDDDYTRAPASPTTVPNVRPYRPPSTASNILKSPRARRVRTTSMSQPNKRTTAESILHADRRTIYTAGRPPWYNCTGGQEVEPFLIGICGASASGKTTVAAKIIESLNIPWVTIVSMDSFYKVLNEKQHQAAMRNEYNFDHPDAFDMELLISVLQRLKEGKKVEVPIYNYVTHSRENRTKTMYGANVIIFEGILAFYNAEVVKMLDMKVFVDTDADIRLARRLRRDIIQRGRELEGVLKQYMTYVKPAYHSYIAPCMAHADIIVPRGGENKVAIHLIVQHVHKQLQLRGFKVREKLAVAHIGQPVPDSLYVLKDTPQVQGLHTFIRNKDTPRDEFIFYSKRLMRLVIEFALSLLPYSEHCVDTPQGFTYKGRKCDVEKICGVSILRAGETMEQAVCDVCKDIRIGKILIQTNQQTDEPELYYLRLPKDIKDYRVILMDATVATGAAAIMAIRVLLDHDVPEHNISLVSLLMAEIGVHSIAYAFPQVKIVTSALDPEINEKFHVMPGIGNFGDRYFGTEPDE